MTSRLMHNNLISYLKPGRIVFTLFALVNIFPVYFALVSSLKTNDHVFSNPYGLPLDMHIENYISAIVTGHIGIYFLNTVFLTVSTLLVSALLGSMAAFILARFRFRGRAFLLMFFISGLMVPAQSTIIPLAFGFGKLKIFDNYPAMILLFTAFNLPMSVFVLTSFIKAIPRELEESAVIDGASSRKIFTDIIIPLSMPALSTVSIFNFLQVWNNLLFPLVLIRSDRLMTISYGLLNFFADKTSDYGGAMAGIVIAMMPPIIAYLFFQEKVEKGLIAGAVKG